MVVSVLVAYDRPAEISRRRRVARSVRPDARARRPGIRERGQRAEYPGEVELWHAPAAVRRTVIEGQIDGAGGDRARLWRLDEAVDRRRRCPRVCDRQVVVHRQGKPVLFWPDRCDPRKPLVLRTKSLTILASSWPM